MPRRTVRRRSSSDTERSLLDRYYAYLDGRLSSAIAQTEPGDLLLVVRAMAWSATR
jgi:hypothetical protein